MTRGVARQVNKRFSLGNDTMASRMRALWLFLGLIMLLAATSVQSGCSGATPRFALIHHSLPGSSSDSEATDSGVRAIASPSTP